jgi:hypothetical protein
MGMSSCDELDELTEFDINEGFSGTITVDIPAESPLTWSESVTIDISENQEISDNLDLIQDVVINSLTYQITNLSGQGTTVTEASFTFNGTSISVSDLDLVAADASGTVFEIQDTSLLNAIGNALENDPSITLGLSGTIDAVPVRFDVVIDLDTTVTIDVL